MLKDGQFGVISMTAWEFDSFLSFNHSIHPSGHVRRCIDLDRHYAEKIACSYEAPSKPSVPVESDDTHAAYATWRAQDRLGPVARLLERTPRGGSACPTSIGSFVDAQKIAKLS